MSPHHSARAARGAQSCRIVIGTNQWNGHFPLVAGRSADALRTALPEKCNVQVSPNSLYEEYRDEFSPFDDEHEEEVSP